MKKDLGEAPLPLGGWLILVGLRLVGGLVMNGNSVMKTFGYNLNVVGQIIRILTILIILYMFIVASLFFKKHKAFPAAYIALEAFSVILNISTFFISYRPNTTAWDGLWLQYTVVLPLISILWILYMLLSRRVKKTFLLNWNETLDQSLVDKANGRQALRR